MWGKFPPSGGLDEEGPRPRRCGGEGREPFLDGEDGACEAQRVEGPLDVKELGSVFLGCGAALVVVLEVPRDAGTARGRPPAWAVVGREHLPFFFLV